MKLARILATLALAAGPVFAQQPSGAVVFERDVLPIFSRHCFTCHGKSSPQAGLDLRTARRALRGSQNGPVVVAGSPDESVLWQKLSSRAMPPAAFKRELSASELDTIRRWIESGAAAHEPAELPPAARAQLARFEQELRPIFSRHCDSCHAEEEATAGLDLSSLESLLTGSHNGPVIVEGFSEKSVLVRKIARGAMPPPELGESLAQAEIRTITEWIDTGKFADYVDAAPRAEGGFSDAEAARVTETDRQFWAFQEPLAAPLPAVRAGGRIRTPIDRWVLAQLESKGLGFSPEATKLTLLRRAYFDLTGLPPTPRQARAFLDDDHPAAYERLLDQLLDSPRYGERWGRHWLDAVGYVDTPNKDHDARTPTVADGMWRYRDYTIKATNEDKPWDRFLVEQIAGDELVDWRKARSYTPETLELLTATGYLRGVLDATDEDISNLPFDRYEAMFKLMEKFSSSALGLTLACARCHSHKFDPIPQRDYYRFLAVFTAAYNPSDWLQPRNRFLYHVSTGQQQQIERRGAEIDRRVGQLQERLATARRPYRQRLLNEKLQQVPKHVREAVRAATERAKGKRSKAQQELVKKYGMVLELAAPQVDDALDDADRQLVARLRREIAALEGDRRPLHKVQALWDVGPAPTIRLLHRGDVDSPGPRVRPGFLTVLSPAGKSDVLPSPQAMGETSGLRLALAQWLTSRDHPLTARVIVNRIWQHHFGKGIVETPGNFGALGFPPTHPELLDWLAVDFMDHGWSAKRLHKMIMSSTVYRQSSSRVRQPQGTAESAVGDASVAGRSLASRANSVDPANRLLWRMNLRRLEAEALRDSVLAVSGRLDGTLGGPPVMLTMQPDGLQTVMDQQQPHAKSRRSVYLLARRIYPLSFLSMFDYPIIDASCTRRVPSATPLQSLAMINSEFLAENARYLAGRVEETVGASASTKNKLRMAYRITLAREPTDAELAAGADHLWQLTARYTAAGTAADEAAGKSFQSLVHMLLSSNEFLYID